MNDKCERHEFEWEDGFVVCVKCKEAFSADFMFGYQEGFRHGRKQGMKDSEKVGMPYG